MAIPPCRRCGERHRNARAIMLRVLKLIDRLTFKGPVAERLEKDIDLWLTCDELTD